MEDLLRSSLVAAAQTGADLLEILQAIIDGAEYEDDYVKLDTKTIDMARNFLHDFRSPLSGGDNETLH